MKKTFLPKIPADSLKSFLYKIAFLAILVILFVILGYYISRNTEYEYTEVSKSAVQDNGSLKDGVSFYRLVLENGNLTVYSPDGEKIYVDADTSILTDYDRQLLSSGICAQENEIRELIHSLMS